MFRPLRSLTGLILAVAAAVSGTAWGADVRVKGSDVTAIAIGQGSSASVTVGGIEGDVEMEGVAVINGKVYIDGQAVPPKATRHVAKDGTVYRIVRRGSDVEVTSEGKKP